MAVSFKVPKSPAKDIFDIDTFLGVDLTNSGADMDERRSPNAENMVRNVPGKVRKRTGYRKEILFGKNTNVNLAVGTSSSEREILVDARTRDTILLYNLTKEITPPDIDTYSIPVYFEFDYKTTRFDVADDFSIRAYPFGELSTFATYVNESVDEWTHFSGTIDLYYYEDPVSAIGLYLYDYEPQTVTIKNFAVLLQKDEDYKWSVPPKYLVERDSTNNAVYGCHIGKTGTFEGNRVVNVNRALDTSSESRSYILADTIQTIKTLGEVVAAGATMRVEFDYRTSQIYSSSIKVYVQSDEAEKEITDATGEWEHYSSVVNVRGAGHPEPKFAMEGNANIDLKNISVMYAKNDAYEWSAAPEDNGGEFHTEDLYDIKPGNSALIDSATMESNAASGVCIQEVSIRDTNYAYFTTFKIEFKITATAEDASEVEHITLKINSDGDLWTKQYERNIINEKIELYLYVNANSLSSIGIRYELSNSSTKKCTTKITEITIHEAKIKKSFDISPIWYLYHVGTDMYVRAHNSADISKCCEGMNAHLSRSWQLNKNLYIIDGNNIYVHEIGKGIVTPIDKDTAYIPTVTIGKEPEGGGTSYESINLLQPGFYELFQGHEGVKKFQLTFNYLDDTECRAWILDDKGNWVLKYENQHFTVDRNTGQITFTTAPGDSPITGEDNVKILAYRTIDDYRERITHCTHGALYGIGGAGDRLFLAGNPDHPNWDFYSQQYDPTYFPDTNYATLGSEQSMITGYAIVNNYLATFKDGFDQSQSVFVREGDLLKTDEGDEEGEGATTEPVFKLINTLQGEGVVAPYTFGYIQTEPLFLTKHGIFAITEQDITGEKYTQNRSFYLDGKLRKEPNPENAMACIYDNQYILALNNQLYILDGLQATRTDKSEPYATRQYVGFYCTNVPALCIWEDEGVWFGTSDGRVCAFNTDIESLDSYNDDGAGIYACWETPDLDGKLFYKNKTFRYFAVRLMSAIRTSAKLYSRKLGVWNFIREETVIGNPIDFANFDFELFSFSQDTTEKVLHTKVRVKKVDKARFRVENDKYNEPFGLFDLALEYIESGNYKG